MAEEVKKHTTLSARILKLMGVFSGVQIAGIICSLIRNKLVAIWLGPAGMGLFGIYSSILDTIGSVTQLGTGTSVIRMLAVAPRETLPRLVLIVRRWGWALGLAGALLTLTLSPWLSSISFGDYDHITGFVILAGGILLLSLSNTEGAIFQGLKLYDKLAKSSLTGAIAGLLVSLPIFYFWRLDGIVWALVIYVVAAWLCRMYYLPRIDRPDPVPTPRETFAGGKEFITLGLYITVTTFATNAVGFLFMSYLNRTADMSVAGLYQSGFTLVNRYIGLIMMSVGMEFFPRLSQVAHSRKRSGMFLSHEIVLLMLVMAPVITIFITADEVIVRVLYDSAFLRLLPFITWAIIGTVFMAWSWCLAYMILAKNDGVTYLVTELLSAVVALGLNILMYDRYGIAGLGIAYTLWYTFYWLEIWAVCHWKYRMRISARAYLVPVGLFVVAVAAALGKQMFGWPGAIPSMLLSLIFSAVGLRRLLSSRRRSR